MDLNTKEINQAYSLKPMNRIKDFAKFVGLSESGLDRMQSEGLLCPADFLIGKAKIRVWKAETILAWLESQRNPKAIKEEPAA